MVAIGVMLVAIYRESGLAPLPVVTDAPERYSDVTEAHANLPDINENGQEDEPKPQYQYRINL